jgi:hypothetical protein
MLPKWAGPCSAVTLLFLFQVECYSTVLGSSQGGLIVFQRQRSTVCCILAVRVPALELKRICCNSATFEFPSTANFDHLLPHSSASLSRMAFVLLPHSSASLSRMAFVPRVHGVALLLTWKQGSRRASKERTRIQVKSMKTIRKDPCRLPSRKIPSTAVQVDVARLSAAEPVAGSDELRRWRRMVASSKVPRVSKDACSSASTSICVFSRRTFLPTY